MKGGEGGLVTEILGSTRPLPRTRHRKIRCGNVSVHYSSGGGKTGLFPTIPMAHPELWQQNGWANARESGHDLSPAVGPEINPAARGKKHTAMCELGGSVYPTFTPQCLPYVSQIGFRIHIRIYVIWFVMWSNPVNIFKTVMWIHFY